MSIDHGTYVGPYVRCRVERVPVTQLHISCPNTACANHGTALRVSYCELCGTRTATASYVETGFAVDQWDVYEEINERLCEAHGDGYMRWSEAEGVHLWKPNVGFDTERDPHLESREDFALAPITPELLVAETAQFIVFFGPELDVLRERYGADAVSVAWGIIQDYL